MRNNYSVSRQVYAVIVWINMICTFRNTVTFIRNIYTAILQYVRYLCNVFKNRVILKERDMKKNVGSVLALYPTPAVVVGTMIENKPAWLLAGHVGIIGHDRIM